MRYRFWRLLFVALTVPHAMLGKARVKVLHRIWATPEWQASINDQS